MSPYSMVGKKMPAIDNREKVTGRAKFGMDLNLPGMLWGKVKRSPLPFARIRRIDKSRAEKMIGVKAVLTAEDMPGIPYGTYLPDELPLAKDWVRYVGDGVAAVAAIDEETAEEALELIDVEYEGPAPVLDPKAAMLPDAPSIHPELANIKNNIAYPFGTQVAEVEVDRETGKVEILGIWAAHDLGRAINPLTAEAQIEGGVVQGVGFALTEQYVWKDGKMLNPNFHDYRLPTFMDAPPMSVIFIEALDPAGPYGAKGLAEPALIPTAPAITNAIYDAIGVRIKDLPVTPEKILRALRGLEEGKG